MVETEVLTLERIASEYKDPDPGRVVDRQFLQWTVDRTLPWLKGPEILELGFGDDQWTGQIIDRFGHTHIVDASQSLLESAQEKYGSNLTCYQSLFEEFEPDKKFDTIIASYVLEHVNDPVHILARSLQWLKPDGHVIIIVPHADSIHRRLAVAMGLQPTTDQLGPTDRQMGHRRVYTISRMESDIAKAGLRTVQKRGTLLKPLPQGMLTNFSDAMIEGFMKLGDTMPMEYASSISFDCVRANI
jgi:ubiquinone/menaquinone biosynthesis C-methylase UbiE